MARLQPSSGARASDVGELYVSSYGANGDAGPVGIHHFACDSRSGALRPLGVDALDAGYSFCVWGPDPSLLYATSARDGGSISGFAVDRSRGLEPLGHQPTGGTEPCHISLHPNGRWLLVSNFLGGSISVHPIETGGAPGPSAQLVRHHGHGPDPELQDGPRVHSTCIDQGGRRVVALEFGADQLCLYSFDESRGQLSAVTSVAAPAGAGPRHLAALGPQRKVVTDELSASITCYDLDAAADELTRRYSLPSTAAPPADLGTNGGSEGGDGGSGPRTFPSEVQASADGRFVYVANRGPDVITVFEVAEDQLTPLADFPCGGTWPRHFAIAGDYLYVANQRSDSVTALRVDPATGGLGPAEVVAHVPAPVCVLPR